MSKAWKGGSTTAWRRVRALVLARDGYRCRLALPGGVCTGLATQVSVGLSTLSTDQRTSYAHASVDNPLRVRGSAKGRIEA